MPRAPRIHIEEGLYFIVTKAGHGRELFRDEEDKRQYKDILLKYKGQYSFNLLGYELMPGMIHLLIELAPRTNISEIMHVINSTYTKYFNGRYERRGHVFEGRFKAAVVQKGGYLAAMSDEEKLKFLAKKAGRSRIVGSREFVEKIKRENKERLLRHFVPRNDRGQMYARNDIRAVIASEAKQSHKAFVIAGSAAILFLAIFSLYLYIANIHMVSRVEGMLEAKETQLKKDLQERYRSDAVSYYHAMAKRLELERKRTEELKARPGGI